LLREGVTEIVQHDMRRPALHPDGTRLAAVMFRDGRFQIVVLDDIRAQRAEVITRGEGNVDCPTWSPDGNAIAFISQPVRDAIQFGTFYGARQLFVIDLASRRLSQLTRGRSLDDSCPVWTEDGIYAVATEQASPTSPFGSVVLRVVPGSPP
jgi:Tol biopolymer transport system component